MEHLEPPPDGDVSHGYIIAAPLISTTVVALIMTVLRIYTRLFVIKKPDWDDLFNALAMVYLLESKARLAEANAPQVFMFVAAGLIIPGATDDIGRHVFYLVDEMDQVSYELMLFRIAEFLLIISTVLMKISIAIFLVRLLYVASS